eukprot:gene4066-14155_t
MQAAVISYIPEAVISYMQAAVISYITEAVISYKTEAVISYKTEAVISYKTEAVISYKMEAVISYKTEAVISYKAKALKPAASNMAQHKGQTPARDVTRGFGSNDRKKLPLPEVVKIMSSYDRSSPGAKLAGCIFLNGQILACTSWLDVYELFIEFSDTLNHVNVNTIVIHTSKLDDNPGRSRWNGHATDMNDYYYFIDELRDFCEEELPRYGPRELSNTAYGFARMGMWDRRLFQLIVARSHLQSFGCQETANLLWALATSKNHPGAHWLSDCLPVLYRHLSNFKNMELVNVLWSLARLGVQADNFFQAGVEELVGCRLHGLLPIDYSNTLWAIAASQTQLPQELLLRMHIVCLPLLHRCRDQELVTALWAVSVLKGAMPPKQWMKTMFDEVMSTVGHVSGSVLKGAMPPKQWMKTMFDEVSRLELVTALWAVSVLKGAMPPKQWMKAMFDDELHRRSPSLASHRQHNCIVLMSMARLAAKERIHHPLKQATQVLLMADERPLSNVNGWHVTAGMPHNLSTYNSKDVSNTLWALAVLKLSPPSSMVQDLARALCAPDAEVSARQLSNTLWAMSRLRYFPGEKIMAWYKIQAIQRLDDFNAQDAIQRLDDFNAQDLSNMIFAMARLETPVIGPDAAFKPRFLELVLAAFVEQCKLADHVKGQADGEVQGPSTSPNRPVGQLHLHTGQRWSVKEPSGAESNRSGRSTSKASPPSFSEMSNLVWAIPHVVSHGGHSWAAVKFSAQLAEIERASMPLMDQLALGPLVVAEKGMGGEGQAGRARGQGGRRKESGQGGRAKGAWGKVGGHRVGGRGVSVESVESLRSSGESVNSSPPSRESMKSLRSSAKELMMVVAGFTNLGHLPSPAWAQSHRAAVLRLRRRGGLGTMEVQRLELCYAAMRRLARRKQHWACEERRKEEERACGSRKGRKQMAVDVNGLTVESMDSDGINNALGCDKDVCPSASESSDLGCDEVLSPCASEGSDLGCDEVLSPCASEGREQWSASAGSLCNLFCSDDAPKSDLEMVPDMIHNDMQREKQFRPSSSLLQKISPEIGPSEREFTVGVLFEARHSHGLGWNTHALAVGYLDRLLSVHPVEKQSVRGLSLACLSLACNHEEVAQHDFDYLLEQGQPGSPAQKRFCQNWLFRKLEFQGQVPTAFSFLHLFCLGMSHESPEQINMACYLVNLILLYYLAVDYIPSAIAAAALELAAEAYNAESPVDKLKQLAPDLDREGVEVCKEALVQLHNYMCAAPITQPQLHWMCEAKKPFLSPCV